MLLFTACFGLSSVALAAPLSDTASKLKWKVHRTVAHRETSSAAGRGAPSSASAERNRVWQASPRGKSGGRQSAPNHLPSMVIAASADKSDPFKDPFEDDKPGDGSSDATKKKASQPTTSDDPFPTTDDRLPTTDDRFPTTDDPFPTTDAPRSRPDIGPLADDPQLIPFEETLPENESVVPGLAPPEGLGCEKYKADCGRAVEALRNRDITKIIFGIVIEGTDGKPPVEGVDYPCECVLGRELATARFAGRNWSPTTFTWKATGTCFKPLYFQDVQLERYGHSWNPVVQPFMSAAHFFVSVPLLPYKMGLHPPHECVYTLGYYRPGSCAPYFIDPIPLSLRAATYQALGVTAFSFWFWPPPLGP